MHPRLCLLLCLTVRRRRTAHLTWLWHIKGGCQQIWSCHIWMKRILSFKEGKRTPKCPHGNDTVPLHGHLSPTKVDRCIQKNLRHMPHTGLIHPLFGSVSSRPRRSKHDSGEACFLQ